MGKYNLRIKEPELMSMLSTGLYVFGTLFGFSAIMSFSEGKYKLGGVQSVISLASLYSHNRTEKRLKSKLESLADKI